ncbi:MAG: hypothetical protein ACLVH8_11560 [Fusobacterium sp.]
MIKEDKEFIKEYLKEKLNPVKFDYDDDYICLELHDVSYGDEKRNIEWDFVAEVEETPNTVYFKDSEVSIIQANNILGILNDFKVTVEELNEIMKKLKWI